MYHLTPFFLGQEITLYPQLPRDRAIFEMAKIKRICVAPSIDECLWALRNTYYNRGIWHLYEVHDDFLPAINVPDAHETNEHWILHPSPAKYKRYVTEMEATIRISRHNRKILAG